MKRKENTFIAMMIKRISQNSNQRVNFKELELVFLILNNNVPLGLTWDDISNFLIERIVNLLTKKH